MRAPQSVEQLESTAKALLDLWFALDVWPISIVWNDRMQTRAGVAWFAEDRIELNPHLLASYPDRIDEILGHELAHLVVWRRHGDAVDPHGPEWASLMELAGLPSRRFHGMSVRGLRRSRRRYYYLHVCADCSSWWVARRVRRDRHCRGCGPSEVQVSRAPATRAGLLALRRRARGHARLV